VFSDGSTADTRQGGFLLVPATAIWPIYSCVTYGCECKMQLVIIHHQLPTHSTMQWRRL
jgi:hypothetical protein